MDLSIEYTTQIWQEGKHFIAHCMPLDVASSGLSLEEARAAAEEAVRLFLLTAAENGTLDEVLEDSGYVRKGDRWESPACIAADHHELAIAV